MSDVSRILDQIQQGEPSAPEKLLPLVYDELRKLAAAKLAQEKAVQTLQPTALVHEAYVRLVGPGPDQKWDHRGHFFAAAAEAMRRILIDAARRRRQLKRGGNHVRVVLSDNLAESDRPDDHLLALDEALTRFAAVDPVKSKLVELRYFAGLSEADAASVLGISRATASRYWTFARAWLHDAMADETNS